MKPKAHGSTEFPVQDSAVMVRLVVKKDYTGIIVDSARVLRRRRCDGRSTDQPQTGCETV